MDLKELLGEELAKQVSEKLGDKKLMLDTGTMVDTKGEEFPKQWMPRSVYNADQKKSKELLAERDADLETLRDSAKGGEAVKQQFTELQGKYKKRDTEAKEALDLSNRKHAVHLELMKQGCNAPELIAPMIDAAKLIDLGEGNYSGADALITPMKEKYKANFTEIVANGNDGPPKTPGNPTPKKRTIEQIEVNYQDALKKGDTRAAISFEMEKAQALKE